MMKQELEPFSKHWKPFHMEGAALLVIDLQRYFLDENSHAFVPNGLTILPSVQSSIERFRTMGRPVFFTRYAVKEDETDLIRNWWGDSVVEGSKESELMEVEPLPGEIVIRKTRYNAFNGTNLLEELKKTQVKNVVIAGVLTHLCCESTARAAFEEGFNVFILTDGTASTSDALHLHSLQSLSHGFATPLTSSDL